MRRSSFAAACVVALFPMLVAAVSTAPAGSSSRDLAAAPDNETSRAGRHPDEVAVAAIVAAIWHGTSPPTSVPRVLAHDDAVVYVRLRRGGAGLAEAWSTREETGLNAVRRALLDARWRLDAGDAPDTAELVIAHGFTAVPYERRNSEFSNIQRGIRGIELRYGDDVERHGPTQVIASNRSFARIIDRFAAARDLSEADLDRGLRLRRFAAASFLVTLGDQPAATRLFRGNRVIERADVTRAAVAEFAGRMARWMARGVGRDGRMTYKYWPSRGRESSANNMIRQWMATLSLVRVAALHDDPAIAELAARNIRYNLRRFYRETDGLGYIAYQDKAKLGAMALAALALSEHPDRAVFADHEAALRRTIMTLWAADGAFRTFLRPAERNDNQNFYPGEALLYLAGVYRETGDRQLRDRLMRSFRFYRSWHLAHRNPAFVPWHTMAYAVLWRETPDPALRDWIFEMNDWLLAMQQRAPAAFPDIDGRFYDPKRRHLGPPHASSTGVYLEGLIQAFRIARETGDTARADAYRSAILRGLRSLMQLEFRDDVDMFYVAQRDRVRGALRTTVYNNEIRVDNVQHGLMAVLEILNAFDDADFLR